MRRRRLHFIGYINIYLHSSFLPTERARLPSVAPSLIHVPLSVFTQLVHHCLFHAARREVHRISVLSLARPNTVQLVGLHESFFKDSFLFLFFKVLRRIRRGSTPARAHYQCWYVYGLKSSQHTAEKERNPSFRLQQSRFRKVVRNPPCALLTCVQEHKNTRLKRRNATHSKKGTECSTKN